MKSNPVYLTRINEYKKSLSQKESITPNAKLVKDFIALTEKYYNHSETGLNPNQDDRLVTILDEYKRNIESLNFDELKGSLEALTCWQEAVIFRYTPSHNVPNKTDFIISELHDLMR